MKKLVRAWARLGAYVDLEPGDVVSDLDGVDLDMLYTEGRITFDGDSYIPDECMDDDMDVKEISEEDFDLRKIKASENTKKAIENVLTSIESISSYMSFADVDDSVKDDIDNMAQRFLIAVQHKLTKELE